MKIGMAGRVAQAFIDSKLTPLLMVAALLIGIFSTFLTPREEEPQIVVPLVDIFVPYPGSSAKEVEERIVKPMEKIINEIQGVEYIYSMARPDFALITVRYLVGENTEDSLVKLWAVLMKNMDKMPAGNMFPLIKTKSIDDVPILSLTLWSETYDEFQLRRVGAELADEIKKIDNVAEVELTGGLRRKIRVILEQSQLRAHHVDPMQIAQQLQAANQSLPVGNFQNLNQDYVVETGEFLTKVDDVKNLVVGVYNGPPARLPDGQAGRAGNPVYLKNVAEIVDGPEEVNNYVFFGYGPASFEKDGPATNGHLKRDFPAVTVSVAKRKGADAMRVAERVLEKVEALKG
ncbi:MAG TPA: efflux RND transporter permease subunit, partial [bacterium]